MMLPEELAAVVAAIAAVEAKRATVGPAPREISRWRSAGRTYDGADLRRASDDRR